ncbi:KAP family P-loop domain protein [Okeanomitos corallinicola TIOX110]|uniref:KAP family P-loop domain protein n=1 Tax=Okeanomitos corallinicola TIOX110 TaxID=3133117 RepID=A0ABZ2UW06_9CYAN
MENENLNILSADNPLTNPKDDKLGYASFAENLANSICKMSPPDGLVMAVYAPWGSGKSTLLNFIVHYLEQKPEEEQPIIVPFNPWWFSGQEDLTKSFFDQLRGVLSEKWKSQGNGLLKQLDSLADRVSTIPDAKAKIFATIVKTLRQPKDIYKLKEEIEKTLRDQNKRILVVIDDIDRLTAEEIRQLFRVIKAVANFPNVIYLLLFDKEVVVKALEDIQKIDGEAYLEKIVQVPFELPLPDKLSLRRLFEADLQKIFADTPEELFQKDHWREVYLQGIEHFITTPRSIRRLINTLMVTYPAVKGEVNFVDFIAIETIRVFCPFIYNIVRYNSELFSPYHLNLTSSSFMSDEERKIFHDSWINQIDEKDRKSIKNIMVLIFPGIRKAIRQQNMITTSEGLVKYRNKLRICVGEIFPRYFRLAIPEGDISNAEMKAISALANDSQAFAEKLLELSNQIRPDGTSRVKLFLSCLRDLDEKDIPLNCVPSILEALFKVGDNLLRLEDQINSSFAMGNEYEIEFLIHQLLERIEKEKRGIILQETMQNGEAIFTIVWQVVSLREQHGKSEATRSKPEEERLVNGQQLEELEQLALDKIRKAAQQDKIQYDLLKVPRLRAILAFWRDLGGLEEIKQWVQNVIKKDQDLVELLGNYVVKNREGYRLDSQWLSPYLEAFEIIERVRNLAEDTSLTETQTVALQQYIKEYEMRERGENPNYPFP